MNKYKKILSWLLLSSLILWNFSFSYAQVEQISTPTQEEKTIIEAEVLKLQSNLFSNSKSYFEKLITDFEKLTNYEETWSSKIEFLLDEESMFWKADINFNLKDYIVKNNNLNSDISWNISLKANYSPVYWSWFELDLTTFASMISKDSEIYALLKDLNFKVSNEDFSKILSALKEQFKDNKYVKLPTDEDSKKVSEMIKNFNPNSVIKESENILSKPLLQTYKKSGDKYFLVPTKYACDSYFELEQKFNFSNRWYNPKTCSETTYKSFVKEFIKDWELYLIINNNENTLGFYTEKEDTVIDFSLNYNEKNINSVDLIITPDQKKYKNEWFNFHFKSKEFLKIIFNSEKWKNFFNFDSELDTNNNFLEINSNTKSKDLNWAFALKNKKITWFYTIKQRAYDYTSEDFKYKLKNVFWIKITWNMNSTNKLEKLNLQFVWVDIKNKKAILTWKTSYDKWNFAVRLSTKSDYSDFDFNWTWYISDKSFKLNSNYTINSKAYDYYWDWINRDKKYTWNFNIILDQSENNNNLKFEITANDQTKDILKLNLENFAKRTYKEDIKIEVPNDFKEFDPTIFQELNY